MIAIASGGIHHLALIRAGAPRFAPTTTTRALDQGLPAFLAASVTGAWPISYQWQFNGSNLPGQTNSVLRLPATQPEQAGVYALVATNAFGSTLQEYQLSVRSLAMIQPPTSQRAFPGQTVTLEVGAEGMALGYQWSFNGKDLAGQTQAQLILTNISPHRPARTAFA